MRASTRNQVFAGMALRLLLAIVIAFGWTVAPWTTTPAYACSCIPDLPIEDYVRRADVILVGTAGLRYVGPSTYGAELADGAIIMYLSPITYQHFQVERYLKGTEDVVMTVQGGSPGYDCSFAGEIQQRYLLFVTREGEVYGTGQCSGNVSLDTPFGQERLHEVRALVGPGRAPEETVARIQFGMPVAAVGLIAVAGVAAWLRGRKEKVA